MQEGTAPAGTFFRGFFYGYLFLFSSELGAAPDRCDWRAGWVGFAERLHITLHVSGVV